MGAVFDAGGPGSGRKKGFGIKDAENALKPSQHRKAATFHSSRSLVLKKRASVTEDKAVAHKLRGAAAVHSLAAWAHKEAVTSHYGEAARNASAKARVYERENC